VSWPDYKNLMALANLLLCSGIGFICVCRVTVMRGQTTRKTVRAAYALVFAAAALSGWSPWFLGDWPGWADIAMSFAVLAYMASSMRAWRNGPPDFAKSDRAPLLPPELDTAAPDSRH